MNKASPAQTVSLAQAMQMARSAWHAGRLEQAGQICTDILTVRPNHRGAQHLMLSVSHGLRNMEFTAISLNDPERYDIGLFSYGAPQVFAHNQPTQPAYLKVGNFCTIGHVVELILGSYHRQDWFTIYPFSAPNFGNLFQLPRPIPEFSATRGDIIIGSDVWIGAHSIILSGVTIGDGAVIGAGSVVARDVAPYEIWAGNPAQFRRERFDASTARTLREICWWDWPKPLIERYSREISSGSEQSLQLLASVAAQVWPATAVGDTGYTDRWLRMPGHRLRVRTLDQPVPGLPSLVVLHGSFGSIDTVFALSQGLRAFCNPVFIDLPGFGASREPVTLSLASFVDAIAKATDQLGLDTFWVCGVSFGGAVALGLAGHEPEKCLGVIALDTPMLAQKLWHNHQFLRQVIAADPDHVFARRFAFEMYGVLPELAVERSYFHLLDKVRQPVLMVTGNVPFDQPVPAGRVANCLDAGDLEKLGMHANVQTATIEGGHDLANENTSGVISLVRDFMVRSAP